MLRRRDAPASSGLDAFRTELTALVGAVAESVVTVRNTTAALEQGSGSGWFFQSGLVVTNHHVIAGEDPQIRLRFRGGRVLPAELLGADEPTDLALLRVDAPGIAALPLAVEQPPLGEPCLAFGSPLGEYTESVSFGIVSGLNRRVPLRDGKSVERLLQTDAVINPGNSGGPLVDFQGRVLGVNTVVRTDGQGVGFAVPASTVASIVPELLEHGRILRPRLGVSIEVVDDGDDGLERERLRVSAAPADHWLQSGDELVSIDGRQIDDRADLFDVLRRGLIGRQVKVCVQRGGSAVELIPVLEGP